MIDAGQHDAAGMTSKPVQATLVEAVSATSHAPLTRVRASLVKDHTDEVPDKSFAADLKRKLALRKVMHPDDDKEKEQDTPPEGMKFLKEDVNYRYASDPKRSCGECVHFRSGACEIVSGLIRSVDTCDKFQGQERGVVVAVLVDTNESEEYVGFDKLKKKLGKSVRDPGAVAYSIGVKKYGKKGMAQKSQAGRDAEDEEVTPPGYEHVVRALKKQYDPKSGVPWAIAWSMKNRGIKPTKMSEDVEGGPGSGPHPGDSSALAQHGWKKSGERKDLTGQVSRDVYTHPGHSGHAIDVNRTTGIWRHGDSKKDISKAHPNDPDPHQVGSGRKGELGPHLAKFHGKSAEGGPGSGPRGGRSKFAPEEHEPTERVRVEMPKQRAARIKNMKVDPARAAVIKKALGTVRASLVAY